MMIVRSSSDPIIRVSDVSPDLISTHIKNMTMWPISSTLCDIIGLHTEGPSILRSCGQFIVWWDI